MRQSQVWDAVTFTRGNSEPDTVDSNEFDTTKKEHSSYPAHSPSSGEPRNIVVSGVGDDRLRVSSRNPTVFYPTPVTLYTTQISSPLQELEDSTSSSLCSAPSLSREQAAKLVVEIREQAQGNARADSVPRIENERLTEEPFATSEAKVVAAAVAHRPLTLPKSNEDKIVPKQVPPVSTPLSQKKQLSVHSYIVHTLGPRPPYVPISMDPMVRIMFLHCPNINKL